MCVLRIWGRHTSRPADPHRGSKGRRLAVALCCFTRRDDFEIYPRGVRVASFVYLTAGEGSSVRTGRLIYPLARRWRSTEGFLCYGRCRRLSWVAVHTCVSPGGSSGLRGCPHTDLPSGLSSVCSHTHPLSEPRAASPGRCLQATVSGQPLPWFPQRRQRFPSASLLTSRSRPASLPHRPAGPPQSLSFCPNIRWFWVLLCLLQIPPRWVASSLL